MKFFLLALAGLLSAGPMTRAADLPALWAERTKCVVAVEYVVETEIDRRPGVTYGVVVDAAGTIIVPSGAIDARVEPRQLKDFKIYTPDDPVSTRGEYLGQDGFTGWHFLRADEKVRAKLVPITTFAAKGAAPVPAMAEEVWGIGLRNKDEDFMPYLLTSQIALIQSLPQRTAIAQREVAGPGLPVFNREGVFLGIASSSFGQSYLQFSRTNHDGSPVLLVNVEESSAFQLADEVTPYLGRIPKNVYGRPLAWLGAYGLEPMDREVARFLKLESRSGAVVSEVLEGSPAEKAGLKGHDIILALDGKPLPRFKPDSVVVGYVEREIERHVPGDTLTLTVLRGTETVEVKSVLTEEPKLMREAERKYFDRLGFTAREFVYGDAVARRAKTTELLGVVANFVRPNSPAAIAGLRSEDWIREIDGVEAKDFPAAIEKLSAIETDNVRPEFVLLVSRAGETAVLRVKLK
jgi:serine protease Do